MSYHATISNLKNETKVYTSKFDIKADLVSLEATVDKLDKLDVDNLKLASIDLKELSDAVEKEVV